MAQVFSALSSKKIANLIQGSQHRIALVAPSIQDEVADAIISVVNRRGPDNIDLVIDFSEDVFRLGYGSINAINKLKAINFNIRNHAGLRIGLFVCDDKAWAFSPVALYIETEKEEDDLPNAIALSPEEANHILLRVSESARKEVILKSQDSKLVEEAKNATVEVSAFPVNDSALVEVNSSLENVPPVPFDVARQVRVFEPYIQYVELKLNGCSIQRHKMQLPKSLIGIDNNSEIENRINTSFNLIDKNSALSSKQLDDLIKEIKDDYTGILKKSDRVILKSTRPEFDKEIENLKLLIEGHQANVKLELSEQLENSKKQLIDYYVPIVMARPPKTLSFRYGDGLTKELAYKWIDKELSTCIPKPEYLIKKMELECEFKDVTLETLEDKSLIDRLKEIFPDVPWEKPFNDYTAAKSSD